MIRKIMPIMLSVLFIIIIMSTATFADTVRLPQTGQRKCYNASGTEIACTGTGQDGEIQAGVAWPNPRFAVSGDCVTDNLTGLMWAKTGNMPNDKKTWQGALNYVASLNSSGGLCGYADWRLPNINELESLVNAQASNIASWLQSQGFRNVQPFYYWSSSTYSCGTRNAWYVHMGDGGVGGGVKSSTSYVWPVRGGQSGSLSNSVIWKTGQTTKYAAGDDGDMQKGVAWPSPRFTDNSNGTVTDNLTGLMWTKDAKTTGPSACKPEEKKTWPDALDYVACLNTKNYLGYNDWRLPNRKELFSLVDHSNCNPAIPTGHPFTNVQSGLYWSSSTIVGFEKYASDSYMWDGNVGNYGKSANHYIWPVRGAASLGH